MTSPSVVRPAVPEDEREIWRLFRALHAENAMFPISETKVQQHIDRLLHPGRIASDDLGPRGLIGVIGPVGALEGVIMLVFGSPWYSDAVTLDECLNYVDPQHRSSNHAKALIAYAKHLVDGIREKHPDFKLVIGVLSTKRTAAKVRLYERQLTAAGAFFLYPADDIVEPIKRLYRN